MGTVARRSVAHGKELTRSLTSNSTFVGAEVDVVLRYTIMPGLTWTPLFGLAFLGDADNTNNRNAQDAFALINRVIYTF